MRSIAEILSELQGPYLWGERDCVRTMEAIVADRLGKKNVYREFHKFTEPESWRHAIKKYGSILAAHRKILVRAGMIECKPPAVFVALAGEVKMGPAEYDARGGRELIAFCDESNEMWYWQSYGLDRVTHPGEVSTAFRFPTEAERKKKTRGRKKKGS